MAQADGYEFRAQTMSRFMGRARTVLVFRAPPDDRPAVVAAAVAQAHGARPPLATAPRLAASAPVPMPAQLNRLLNVTVLTGSLVVFPLVLLLVPEVRADATLLTVLAAVAVAAVGPFAWAVVRVRRAHGVHAAAALRAEHAQEHPLLVHLRTAAPDRHGVVRLDLSVHPGLDAEAVDDMVVAAGWEVVSGEDEVLYLCRPAPRRPDHGAMSAPAPPPDPPLPRAIRARYNWAALVFSVGVVTFGSVALFPDRRVAIAIGTVITIVGIGLLQRAGAARRRAAR